MELTLPSAAEELLREIKLKYQETSQVSDEHLLGLKFIFGPTALYALDLVDQRSVTHVTSPSGRSTFQPIEVGEPISNKSGSVFDTSESVFDMMVTNRETRFVQQREYCEPAMSCRNAEKAGNLRIVGLQVTGSSGKVYTCYKACHYCSCPAFSFSVLKRNDSLMCKHILAVYLSQATGCCQDLSVSDKQMGEILLSKED